MYTYKVMVQINGRLQYIFLQANNMIDARFAAEGLYGKANVKSNPIKTR